MTLHGIDIWALIAFLFLLPPAIAQMFREWEGPPMLSWRHLRAARWTICLLAGGVIFFGHQWFETIGFNKDWPDAIACRWKARDQRVDSEYVFYYKGKQQQDKMGVVRMYFLPGDKGSQPDPSAPSGYQDGEWDKPIIHEIWFHEGNQTLIRPEPEAKDKLDTWYKHVFLHDLDCGGETIKDIKTKFIMAKR